MMIDRLINRSIHWWIKSIHCRNYCSQYTLSVS